MPLYDKDSFKLAQKRESRGLMGVSYGRASFGDESDGIIPSIVWAIFPWIIGFAVFMPVLIAAYHHNLLGLLFSEDNVWHQSKIVKGDSILYNNINKLGGDDLLKLFSIIPSAIFAFGVYKLAKLLNAPIWAASLVSCLSLIMPLFNYSPMLWEKPDEALFASIFLILAYSILKTIKKTNNASLLDSFIIATILFWFGKLSLIMSFGFVIFTFALIFALSPRQRKSSALLLLVAFCWGPLFKLLSGKISSFEDLKRLFSIPTETTNNALSFIGYLPDMLTFVILLIGAILGIVVLFFTKSKSEFKFAALTLLVLYLILSLFSGSISLTRMIMDYILLAFVGIGFNLLNFKWLYLYKDEIAYNYNIRASYGRKAFD